MGWRWRKVINLGGGLRANMSRGGVGWSWGIPGFRVGKGADGSTWLSIGIPGTGIYFTKRLRKVQNIPQEQGQGDQVNGPTGSDDMPKIKRWRDL